MAAEAVAIKPSVQTEKERIRKETAISIFGKQKSLIDFHMCLIVSRDFACWKGLVSGFVAFILEEGKERGVWDWCWVNQPTDFAAKMNRLNIHINKTGEHIQVNSGKQKPLWIFTMKGI